MSSSILKSTVSKRRFIISNVQNNVTDKEVDQIAYLIPFDSLSTILPLTRKAYHEALDFIVDTQQLPLYANFDFNKIKENSEKEVALILDGVEYSCIIKREPGTSPNSFFKQNFIIKRS